MRRLLAAIAFSAAALTGLALAGGSVEARSGATQLPTQSVSVSFVRFYTAECNCYKARVFGRVSSGAPGEEVVILQQYCGRSFGTAVGTATTREGGFFETEIAFVPGPDSLVSASFRARWGATLSAATEFRGKLSVAVKRVMARTFRVTVSTQHVNPQNMKGRQVVLQRQVDAGWTRVAGGRLAAHRVLYYTFVATFRVPRTGWTLRAVVPSRAAAPCFTASTSRAWVS